MCSRVLSPRLAVVPLLAALLLLAAAACGQGQEEEGPAPTATELAAPTDIRQVDFAQVEEVRKLIDRLGGGEVVPAEVIFADLTGDGSDEAVVPISSGGSGGHLAFAVFGYRDGELTALLTVRPESGRVAASVEEGLLKQTQPVYGPEDPLCCPGQLQNTYYRWDGRELVVDRAETVDNPTAKP